MGLKIVRVVVAEEGVGEHTRIEAKCTKLAWIAHVPCKVACLPSPAAHSFGP